MTALDLGKLLKDAAYDWWEDRAPRLGAALAYYTVFSLAPLLLIAIAIAGFVFGSGEAKDHIIGQLEGLVGEDGGRAIRAMVENASQPGAGIVATIVGVTMLLIGATALFGQLQDALNTIWGVEAKAGRGVWGFVRDRFLTFTMVMTIAFLLMASLVVSAVIAATVQLLGQWQVGWVGHLTNEAISLLVITVLFAMIFRFLPDVKIAWKDVWLGAVLTALLFEVGKFLIGLYLGHSGVASTYGAAGSLAVLLVWLYYSAQIFLFGAEFTKVYANHYGSRIVPSDNAVAITVEARAKQGLPPSRKGAVAS